MQKNSIIKTLIEKINTSILGMRIMAGVAFLSIILTNVACSNSRDKDTSIEDRYPVSYENELFSIRLPKGWIYSSQEWHGLEAFDNSIHIYDDDSPYWFYIVKTFYPFEGNLELATEKAKLARFISGDSVTLLREVKNRRIGGYPTNILYFANVVQDSILIQKQHVTYLEESKILMYINLNYFMKDTEIAEKSGDSVLATLKIKKVNNPLLDSVIFDRVVDSAYLSRKE
jgi:hypothetical protein